MPIIEGAGLTGRQSAGAPSAGTSEVNTLTINATGGTFKLSYDGEVSAAIAWNATNNTLVANVNAALDALDSLAAGEIVAAVGTMTAGVGTLTLTFGGNSAKLAVNTVQVADNSLTGTATCSIVKTTPGVSATERGTPKGGMVVDTTNGKQYINTGTSLAPTWTVVGAQT